LIAVPFDADRLEVTGPPMALADNMFRDPYYGIGNYAVSRDGLFVRVVGGVSAAPQSLVTVDRHGVSQLTKVPPAVMSGIGTVSPDGTRFATYLLGATPQISLYDLARGTSTRLTYEWDNESPIWSPTGDRIAFIWRSNVWQDQAGNPMPGTSELRVVDVASGTVTSLITAPAVYSLDVIAFSPEGDRILFSRVDNNVTSLWDVRADGSDARRRVTGTSWGDWQLLPAGS
jgi:Tol biopolymer transport system component